MAHLGLSKELALVGLVAASLTACESPLSPAELLALGQAEARWAARPFPDYAIEMRQACFCPAVASQWARVEVVAGNVSRVVVLETGVDVPLAERPFFPTVEQVFNYIRAANSDDGLKDLVVQFDRALGFPAYVSFVSKPDILDGGGTYYLRNARPVL